MKEEVREALKEAINSIEETKGFVVEQSPDVVQQFLQWKLIESSAGIVISLLIFLALLYGLIRLIKYDIKEDDDNTGGPIAFLCITTIISLAVTIHYAFQLACIVITPKWYIVETVIDKV